MDGTNETQESSQTAPVSKWYIFRQWWFAIIALVAIAELSLLAWQSKATMHPEDWKQLGEALEEQIHESDLVVAAPSWIDPIARMNLGDTVMTVERLARADESRFERAFEVSLGRSRSDDVRGWSVKSEQKFGQLWLRELINPAPRPVIDDLVTRMNPSDAVLAVRQGTRDQACPWGHYPLATGNLGFGPAIPVHRANCITGQWVGVTINADTRYRPRRCIIAPPGAGRDVLQIHFVSIQFGKAIVGHHGLYVEAERDEKGSPVTIAFTTRERPLGSATHADGEGWTEFEIATPDLAGTKGPLDVAISCDTAHRRMYCFEATTR